MNIKIIISSAIVSAIVAALGGIITTIINQRSARKIAQEAANQEIRKMERTWEREDVVSSDEEFAEMAKAVAQYIHRNTIPNSHEAIGLVASIRAKEYGELGKILDELQKAIDIHDLPRADRELTKAINKKRELKYPDLSKASAE